MHNAVKGNADCCVKNSVDDDAIKDIADDRDVDNSVRKFVKIDQDNNFQETCNRNTKPISPIKLPPKVRTRGRPKGAGLLILAVISILLRNYLVQCFENGYFHQRHL